VPTPTRRFALGIGVLATMLILTGVGAGVAVAEPDDTGNPPDTGQSSEPSSPSEPSPTTAPMPVVKSPLSQLRDLLQRPRAIFGNGRVPGRPTPIFGNGAPPITGPEEVIDPLLIDPKPGDVPPVTGGEPVEGEPKEPYPNEPVDVEPPPVKKPSGHSARVQLPFSAPFSIPLPTRPGARATQFSIDLSDPFTALASVNTSVNQLNTLISEAIAPYNPFPPKPPEPTLRIMEEAPVADAGGGFVGGGGVGGADGGAGGASGADPMPPVPVLQAPMALPMPRIGPPRPIVRTVPAGVTPQVIGAGSAGVRTPEIRGSLTQTGSVPGRVAPADTTSAGLGGTGNTAFRQGYPQYLRTARVAELAVVAVPGIAGLLALTASGGMLGYRQANSGRYLRADAARFLQ
jgi:hypothetical protein